MDRMAEPLISVVIPVYNNEKYLPKAVESVLKYDLDCVELIIVDDGSTDSTPEIADEIAGKNKNVKVVHQTNQWIYASMNNGIRAASGKYVYILNSDDRLFPGAIQLLIDKINEYGYPDVIWTNVICNRCNDSQEVIESDVYNWRNQIESETLCRSPEEVALIWPYLLKTNLAHNQANLYLRELALAHPFRNDVYGGDVFFNIGIACDVRSSLILTEPVYEFIMYSQATMNASVGKYYSYEHDMFNEIMLEYLALFEGWHLSPDSYQHILFKRRMREVTHEIKALSYKGCNMSTDEKIEYLFNVCADEKIMKLAVSEDNREEYESRILSGLREILTAEELPSDSKMYFAYEMLDALLGYERDENDYLSMNDAVNNLLNPMHIGEIFLKKLKKAIV